MDFQPFPSISRLSRDIVITEKLDGTNAQICIYPNGVGLNGAAYQYNGLSIKVGSRTRWITPEDDNHGFAK